MLPGFNAGSYMWALRCVFGWGLVGCAVGVGLTSLNLVCSEVMLLSVLFCCWL